ncbi:endopeptidase La [Nitrincola sp.]|uniref:endopeptidase La n=1 Tax=Nitrincola sp. TaxID=1926584 RepID=UPI003A8D59D0
MDHFEAKDDTASSGGVAIELPVLPLRDVVVYPHMVIPLFVGRAKSIRALDNALAQDKQIVLVAQKSASEDEPVASDLFHVGTVATVLQMLKLPDGTVKVLVEGEYRARIACLTDNEECFSASLEVMVTEHATDAESDIYKHTALDQFERFIQVNKKIPAEVLNSLQNIDDIGRLADTLAAHMALKLDEKQKVLEMLSSRERLEYLMAKMEAEIDLVEVEKRIRGRVKKQMEKSQREYYLNEQMKAIQKELGDMDESGGSDMDELRRRIEAAEMPEDALKKTLAEHKKLQMMSPMSAEATVVRGYIDWMLQIPWKKRSKVRLDMQRAQTILDEDHFGLDEVKERIVEYLAVQKRVKKLKGPILCLVGPPGVGKTSLGKSIARATNREYVRMALGGVRDEAEIRGHRRTYIGSMPGKLVQKITKSGVKNPLFLLDEIDKMGMDHRGDPSSALLEVLDPEQNNTFNDHYLEVDMDLSDVLFICTSNSMNIPGPLLDRMEIIRIPGYTEDEKLNIAKKYLITKQMKQSGLKTGELEFTDEAILDLIRYYTREAGVRGLEREIAKICRKAVREFALKQMTADLQRVTSDNLEHYSGVHKHSYGKAEEEDLIGHVTGLAWTQVGGEILSIEAALVPGKGRQIHTGSLGDVMKESIQAALTVVRNRSQQLGIRADFHEKHDIHIHVPEGATPKDGPSAGIGMCTALVSVLTGIPVRSDVAMTGEITLRGQVLPIGGLKEKLLAAHRGGITTVIIPDENKRDLKEIPENIKADLDIIAVKWIDEVLDIALTQVPEPLSENETEIVSKESGSVKAEPGQLSTH